MKLLPLLAFALASPVAQETYVPDTFDQGDWWGLDVTGTGVGSGDSVMLVNGPAVRTGDTAVVQLFLVYRQPKPSGVTGSRSTVTIDCKANTQDAQIQTRFYTEKRMRLLSQAGTGAQPILPASALYRFACAGSTRYSTHFGEGSRTRIAAGAFSKYPH